MSSTRSHKRKNSHLFLQRKNSSSADMSIELNNFTVPDNQDVERQPLSDISNSLPRLDLRDRKVSRFTLLVIAVSVVISCLLVIPIYTASSSPAKPSSDKSGQSTLKSRFTIDDVLNGDFLTEEKMFRFVRPPGLIRYHDSDPGLYLTTEVDSEGKTGFVARQLYHAEFSEDLGLNEFSYEGTHYTVQSVKVSHRLDKMILGTDLEPEFRYSSRGHYFLRDTEMGTVKPITPLQSGELVKISYAHFSPNYNYIYFVFGNDLYIQNVYTNGAAKRITTDGSADVSNGKPDWVYEEEILASEQAVWWSPDDAKLVFAKFNDSSVESYHLPKFTTDAMYPPITSIKYPKPGTENPEVELYLFDMRQGVLYLLSKLSFSDDEPVKLDSILYDADWLDSDSFMFKVTDRSSKKMSVKIYNARMNTLMTTRTIDSSSYNGWIEKTKKILPIPPNEAKDRKGTGYVDIQTDANGYNHLFYFSSVASSEGTQITSGNWEITGSGIVGYEYETDTIFFTANEIDPMSQHLYAASLDFKGERETHLTILQETTSYDFYEFQLSSSGRYALMKMKGPDLPYTAAGLLSDVLDYKKINQDEVLILTKNEILQKSLEKHAIPSTSYKTMVTEDGATLDYVEIKPAHMDAKKKYPLLVSVYGGPGSRTYTNKFNIFFEQAVASGLDAIVLQIEPRSVGGKGWKYKSMAKEKLGYWEPRDVAHVTRTFMQHNQANIDEKRVAIWGWSYGGYTSLKTIEYDQGNTFKYMMAVAPVTNWTLYNSFYTERYMNKPSKNPSGYSDIAVVKDIAAFRKLQRFVVMHGTADDNVHIQNTYQFVDKLNLQGIKNYDMVIFPDSDHSIRYHNAQRIIFERLYAWLSEAFSGHLDIDDSYTVTPT
ncbi:hypothetical protein HG536_0A07390 [Torulaspora globosa]|uniref:Peptidase S9 prolyl oligopeptidase catalytic domain-containing protein n=1 Tax=Torulaspora globosa TaxID=48254 RepID=A0A7G3ZBN8_9SACH|nr:uncharacterized protein HG536_0A07390 [Torulaspora globosa]QLL30924.1 hypothetical protein HG536_0A07390 [Torulaspora globosa]